MEVFKSKKFLMSIGGVAAVLLAHFLNINESAILEVVAIVVSFVVGQGVADAGKEAAKLKGGK